MLYSQRHWNEYLSSAAMDGYLKKLYPNELARQRQRYAGAISRFGQAFGGAPAAFISAPGRAELGGNHTDHQCGCVLAAAVTLDKAAAVAPTGTGIIRVFTDGFSPNTVELGNLAPKADEVGNSSAIVRGIAARLESLGYRIGGFDALVVSDVPSGSGLSSSASFEILICTIMNHLFNDGRISAVETALIGQYAENVYFGKSCGLMDQLSSATGGIVSVDFKDPANPVVEKISQELFTDNYRMCIVNTGGSHAGLTPEYAGVTDEMAAVAGYFGCKVLREVAAADFYKKLPALRKTVSDRAILRAIHFFAENERVPKLAGALKAGDAEAYLTLMRDCGSSSFSRLQNAFPASDITERGIALALAVSEELLKDYGGAWRVHGGGFAGTIQAMVPLERLDIYRREILRIFGSGCFYELSVRPVGGHIIEID